MSQSGLAHRFVDQELAKRLEHGQQSVLLQFAAIQRLYRADADPAALPIAGGYAVFAGKESLLTRAIGLGMNGPVSSSEMDTLESFFRSRGADIQVEVIPSTHPSLLSLVRRRGYRPREINAVLVRALADVLVPPAASAIEVRTARPDEAELWTQVLGHAYFESGVLRRRHMTNLPPLFHLPNSQPVIAFLDGQPAGASCASLVDNQELALLFAAATLAQFRGRGVHRAMIAWRLRWAAGLGAGMATLSTLPHSVSYRNVLRFGFSPVYDKMTYVAR